MRGQRWGGNWDDEVYFKAGILPPFATHVATFLFAVNA